MAGNSWDYTDLAATYSYRPPYAPAAVDRIVALCPSGEPRVADIGAGTGHLTLDLLDRGCVVAAVEPNEAMRRIGMRRTDGRPGVRWSVGTGERNGLADGSYDLVTYGSSFSTVDRPAALRETARILVPGGWFACIWNHRQLDDPLQAEIEDLIKRRVAGYSYGTRREDQAPVIEASPDFGAPTGIEEPVTHRVPVEDWMSAWRSHATLQRQAGPEFEEIVQEIDRLVRSWAGETVEVPYVTVGWIAQRPGGQG